MCGFPKICLLFFLCVWNSEADNLRAVSILFRHGDRTILEHRETFPTDPYKYFPTSNGQLTELGELRAFQLGQHLRTRYENFLSPNYSSDIVKSYCGLSTRTVRSLQLVLAGLFPASVYCNNTTHEMPIPDDYNFVLSDEIILLPTCDK